MATWSEHRVVAACSLCEAAHMYAICSLFAYAAFYVVDSGWASDRDAAGFVAGLLGSAVTLGRIPVAALWGAAADGFGRRRCVVASMAALAVGQVAFGVVESLPAVLASRALLGASCGWPVVFRAAQESEIPDFKGSDLGRFPLVVFPIYASEALGPEKQSLLIGARSRSAGSASSRARPSAARPTGSSPRGRARAEPRRRRNRGRACAAALWLPEAARAGLRAGRGGRGEELPEKGAKAIEAPPPEREPCRMIFGFNEFAANEATSLWAVSTRRSGGLELSHGALGALLAACAAAAGLLRDRPAAERALARGARRRRAAAAALSVAAMPFSRSPWAAGVAMALHGAGYICGQIGILTITNNAVESSRRRVGGAMSTAEAIAKGLGPWSASVLFAESIRSGGAAFHAAVFLGLAALYATAAVLARALPARVDAAAS
ncbi:major facilitator superfamily-like protein [Aureococcus anophagefferens]|nr:major facilitator superfamily-like protein [Aureococcus anophagefferens]